MAGKETGAAADAADFEPMEARLVDDLPGGKGWSFEPKWDGFRCLASRRGDAVDLRAKSGKPLARFFPEIADLLRSLPQARFVVDGELVVPIDGDFSFDALQMRLHPAESRIRRLAAETPAELILFDMLATPAGDSLLAAPFSTRRAALEQFYAEAGRPGLHLSPVSADRRTARRWLEAAGGAVDGIVAKPTDGPYQQGERAMLKVKRLRTADCVVGGFRYGTGSRQVGSLLLGLYDDDGKLHHVGFTSTIARDERAALTRRLEALRAAPGFTGRAPGGPSRWATERSGDWEPLEPELVVEVRYDHVTDRRFRHGARLVRWRPDKAPRQCTFEQIAAAMRPADAAKLLARRSP
jgi:ATP-dependent DNA ligase